MTIIKIYEPHEKPFGLLSNNSEHKMYIETGNTTQQYTSVTNYIYSNMLSIPTFKDIVRTAVPKKVFLEYEKLSQQEIITVLRKALDNSLKVRYNEIPELVNILLSTGESEIRYMSLNEMLGMGKDGTGLNLYGKNLMQLRQQIKQQYLEQENQKNQKEREHQLYITYIIYKELVKKILAGDNLDDYQGKTAETILNTMMNSSEIMSKYPDETFIIENLHRKYSYPQSSSDKTSTKTKKEQEDEFLKFIDKSKGSNDVFAWVKAKIKFVDDNKYTVTYESGITEDNVPKIRIRFKNPTTQNWDREPSSSVVVGSDVLVKINKIKQKEFAQDKPGAKSSDLKKPTRPKDWRVLSPGNKQTTIKGAMEPVTSIMIEQDIYDILNYPPSLVNIIRKKYLERMKQLQLSLKAQIIFDMWMDFELRRLFPNIPEKDYGRAKIQQFKNLKPLQQADLQIRVEKLYNNKNLPKGLEENITTQIRTIIIPTDEEIKQAVEYSIPQNAKTSDVFAQIYFGPSGPPIEIYPTYHSKPERLREKEAGKEFTSKDELAEKWERLSPLYDGYPSNPLPLFEIDNQKFPTITHYIYFSIIDYYMKSKTKSYQEILSQEYKNRIKLEGNPSFINQDMRDRIKLTRQDFLRPDIIETKIKTQIQPTENAIKLRQLAKVALDKKYEDRVLQDVLLITENNDLEWADYKDPVLGIGPNGKGENFIGKYWMLLREKIVLQREGETLPYLTTKNILDLIERDAFFKAWIEMRVIDMCRTIVTMKNYVWEKTRNTINAKITPEFARSVLDDVFQPCSHIFARVDDVLAPVPKYFENIILYNRQTKGLGFSKLDQQSIKEISEIIWKRIVIMIDTMIMFSQEKDILNIRSILANLELLLSNSDFKCADKILENEYENCILSALLNIIDGLLIFDEKFELDRTITKTEIDTAASMIINKDVSDQIQHIQHVTENEQEDEDDVNTPNENPLSSRWGDEDISDDENADEKGGYLETGEIPDEYDQGDDEEPYNPYYQGEPDPDDDPSNVEYQQIIAQDEQFSSFPKMSSAKPSSTDFNLLVNKLKKMDGVDDPRKIANILLSAISIVKTQKPKKTINNRINFFASQR